MKNKQMFLNGLFSLLIIPTISYAQTLSPEDVQDLDKSTGIGCTQEKPVTEKADYYFVCKSKKSAEQAWNAAMYRSKVACSVDELVVFFNVPPSLPEKDGFFGSQIEVSCEKRP